MYTLCTLNGKELDTTLPLTPNCRIDCCFQLLWFISRWIVAWLIDWHYQLIHLIFPLIWLTSAVDLIDISFIWLMSTVEFIDIFIDLIDVSRGFNWYFLWFDWRFPLISSSVYSNNPRTSSTLKFYMNQIMHLETPRWHIPFVFNIIQYSIKANSIVSLHYKPI